MSLLLSIVYLGTRDGLSCLHAPSWASVAVFLLGGIRRAVAVFTLFGMAYIAIPATVAAFVANGVTTKRASWGPLRVSMHINRWWIVVLLTPAVLVACRSG